MPLGRTLRAADHSALQTQTQGDRVAVGILLVTVLTVVGMVAFTSVGNTNPPPAIGCINPTVAGIVGAETLNRCGQEAVETCSHAAEFTGARAETIVANCEKQRVKF